MEEKNDKKKEKTPEELEDDARFEREKRNHQRRFGVHEGANREGGHE